MDKLRECVEKQQVNWPIGSNGKEVVVILMKLSVQNEARNILSLENVDQQNV